MAVAMDVSQFNALGDRLVATASRVGPAMAGVFREMEPELRAAAITAIQDVTPVGRAQDTSEPSPGTRTPYQWNRESHPGALRDSTDALSTITGDALNVAVIQPAETEPDQSGNWGGEHYVRWVIDGRGPVYPVIKRALAGPGFGPAPSAGPSAPNNYPAQAVPTIQSAAALIASRHGRAMLTALMGGQ